MLITFKFKHKCTLWKSIYYCDFIVWNENDIYIERVQPDIVFWDSVVPKAEMFFKKCILPEVLGNFFLNHFLPFI